MSSSIRVNKICELCRKEFEARKTTTKTCSDACAKRLYKLKKRETKVNSVTIETQNLKKEPIEALKVKEFLSIAEACKLLGIGRSTLYRMIEAGQIKRGKAGSRAIIKRSELDKLFI